MKPPKLHVKFWGISVEGEGAWAIVPALVIVLAFLGVVAFFRM